MQHLLDGLHVLITGGTGSLGNALCRRLLANDFGTPSSITVFSRDEAKQDAMRHAFPTIHYIIGDVRRFEDVLAATREQDVIINAAALKQVPSCEYAPEQALLTNCVGAQNIVRAVQRRSKHVTVVGVSTDKACEPVNVMGMTKALQERIFIAANLDRESRFVCVRYGNVLASRGSVVPLFQQQITAGGPVTITNPGMTRFLLSLDTAVDTIMAAIAHGERGETFIPSVRATTMLTLAQAMIGKRSIPIVVTGTRPGEKTHETLISESEALRTVERGDYYVIAPMVGGSLGDARGNPAVPEAFRSSDRAIQLTVTETAALLKAHGLVPT